MKNFTGVYRFIILFAVILWISFFAAAFSSAFLYSLRWVTSLRESQHEIIFALPVFGFLLGLILKRLPSNINQGVPYLVESSENTNLKVSPWMAPFVLVSSLGTHLFGGSAGREGVGVVMGASVSHGVLPFFQRFTRFQLSNFELRPYLIYCGIAAGFSSIFGTPFAATFFIFELKKFKHSKNILLFFATTLSALGASFFSHLFGPEHFVYPVSFQWSIHVLYYLVIAVFTSAMGGLLFYWGLKLYSNMFSRWFRSIEWKLFFGGMAICLLVFFTNGYQYIGLGIESILQSFTHSMQFYDFAMKCVFTVMTIAIGFKGGEVTPLFFMGATFSNSVASLFHLNNYALSSSLGMVSIFAAVTATPIASGVMAIELFGWKAGGLAFICCVCARFLMGNRSVYRQ